MLCLLQGSSHNIWLILMDCKVFGFAIIVNITVMQRKNAAAIASIGVMAFGVQWQSAILPQVIQRLIKPAPKSKSNATRKRKDAPPATVVAIAVNDDCTSVGGQ